MSENIQINELNKAKEFAEKLLAFDDEAKERMQKCIETQLTEEESRNLDEACERLSFVSGIPKETVRYRLINSPGVIFSRAFSEAMQKVGKGAKNAGEIFRAAFNPPKS